MKVPFTLFENLIQRALNVTPTQLHQNRWGFVRAFEILCRSLKVVPNIGVLFSFLRTKGEGNGKWISFTGHQKKRLLTPFSTSYKDFKVEFFRVRGSPSCPQVFIDNKGAYHFPLYWQRKPFAITDVVEEEVTDDIREIISLLSGFVPMC